jgi:hypothetical protein
MSKASVYVGVQLRIRNRILRDELGDLLTTGPREEAVDSFRSLETFGSVGDASVLSISGA